MPKSEKDKDSLLQRIRANNPVYSEKVSTAMKQISNDTLANEKALEAFSNHITEQRKLYGFTLTEIADMLELTHTAIKDLESLGKKGKDADSKKAAKPTKPEKKPNKVKSIDSTYLEVFSLIYNVSPLYLIGLTDKSGCYTLEYQDAKNDYIDIFEPLIETDPNIRVRVQLILRTLNTSEDNLELNQHLISSLARICMAKSSWREVIKNVLISAPAIQKIMKTSLDIDIEKENQAWRDFYFSSKGSNIRNSNSFDSLLHLGALDFELLDIMAHIALSNETLKAAICDWLEVGGFLSKPYAFR